MSVTGWQASIFQVVTVAASLGAGLMSDRRHQLRRRIIHSTLANETIAEEGDGGGDGLMAPESQPNLLNRMASAILVWWQTPADGSTQ